MPIDWRARQLNSQGLGILPPTGKAELLGHDQKVLYLAQRSNVTPERAGKVESCLDFLSRASGHRVR